jgi:hypothetical protein
VHNGCRPWWAGTGEHPALTRLGFRVGGMSGRRRHGTRPTEAIGWLIQQRDAMIMQRESLLDSLIDRDIEHIRASILWSFDEATANPLLTSPYWRRRIGTLMRLHHLSKAQLAQADAILAIIDQFDLAQHVLPLEREPSLSHCHPVLPLCTFPSHLRVKHP